MLLLTLAAAAGAYTAPVPIDPQDWISAYFHFPARGVQNDVLTVVTADIIVNPYGGISDCRARATQGNPNMAEYTCKILRGTGSKFKPARDPSGKRMYGLYRQNVAWWTSAQRGTPPPKYEHPVEFRMTVDRIPPDTEDPESTEIQFAVDVAGNGSSCSPTGTEGQAVLGQLACQRLANSLRVQPATDRKGRPVPSVQNARVKVILAKAAN